MVISVLVVALVYSPAASTFYVFAVPPDPGWSDSGSCLAGLPTNDGYPTLECCWRERIPGSIGLGEKYCQTCTIGPAGTVCSQKELQFFEGRTPGLAVLPEDGVLEQPPTPPSGPAAPLQDGGVLQQPPTQGVAPPLTRGQGVLPQDGVLQQTPSDEGTEPPVEDEATQPPSELLEDDCPEGQILDEETGLCVLVEENGSEDNN